jgi:hypothetical protein
VPDIIHLSTIQELPDSPVLEEKSIVPAEAIARWKAGARLPTNKRIGKWHSDANGQAKTAISAAAWGTILTALASEWSDGVFLRQLPMISATKPATDMKLLAKSWQFTKHAIRLCVDADFPCALTAC